MADSTSFSLYNTRNIPEDKVGFIFVKEILYDSLTKNVSLKYSNDVVKNLGTVDPGTARKITNIALDSNNNLIISFDDLTAINAGRVMVEYEYSNAIPTGLGVLSATESAVFKPLVAGNANVTITNNAGVTNISTTLPAVDPDAGFAGALAYSNYSWFVEQWSSTAALQGPLSVANTWQTRVLNTQRVNNANLVFNSTTGEIQLPIGTYYATAIGKSYRSSVAKLAVRDVTNNITLLDSMSEVNYAAAATTQLTLNLRGYIKVSAPITIKLMQLSSAASANSTMGEANGTNATMGQTGTFSELNIWKISNTVLPDVEPVNADINEFLFALQQNYYLTGSFLTASATRSALGASISGTELWYGSVVAPNGKIYCVPYSATDILIIDPVTNTATRSAMGATLTGTSKWVGGCLGPDGKIYCVPRNATDILIIDPVANTATRSAMGASLAGTNKWYGAVAGSDGKIYGIPWSSTDILIIDPVANTATRSAMGADLSGSLKWQGGCLSTNGKIYCTPRDATDILTIDLSTNTASRSSFGADLSGSDKWYSSVLGLNGKLYCIPHNATDILIIDPATNTATRSAMGADLSGANKWLCGALLSDGKIYGIPYNSTNILVIDTITGTATTSTLGGSLTGSAKWASGVLALNGKIYSVPVNATDMLILSNLYDITYTSNIVASAHLNKF